MEPCVCRTQFLRCGVRQECPLVVRDKSIEKLVLRIGRNMEPHALGMSRSLHVRQLVAQGQNNKLRYCLKMFRTQVKLWWSWTTCPFYHRSSSVSVVVDGPLRGIIFRPFQFRDLRSVLTIAACVSESSNHYYPFGFLQCLFINVPNFYLEMFPHEK